MVKKDLLRDHYFDQMQKGGLFDILPRSLELERFEWMKSLDKEELSNYKKLTKTAAVSYFLCATEKMGYLEFIEDDQEWLNYVEVETSLQEEAEMTFITNMKAQ